MGFMDSLQKAVNDINAFSNSVNGWAGKIGAKKMPIKKREVKAKGVNPPVPKTVLTLRDFKSVVKDVARPNRFIIDVVCPFFDVKSPDIRFLVKSAQIPAKTIGDIEVKKLGKTFKVAGDVSYEDLTFTFISDYSWEARAFFENWMNKITDTKAKAQDPANTSGDTKSTTSLYVGDYLDGSIVIRQIGNTIDSVLATYMFYDVWPKSVNEMELSADSENQVSEFQVTFTFSEWERIGAIEKADTTPRNRDDVLLPATKGIVPSYSLTGYHSVSADDARDRKPLNLGNTKINIESK